MKSLYCSNCGEKQSHEAKFCHNCGAEAVRSESTQDLTKKASKPKMQITKNGNGHFKFEEINKKIALKNSQTGIVKKGWYSAIFFILIMFLCTREWSPIYGAWALMMISLFFTIASLVVVFVFRQREKKLDTLISKKNLLAYWKLSKEQKAKYVNHQYEQSVGKNKAILTVIGVISTVIFGLFILFMEEGKLFMFLVLVGLLVLLTIFAFGMPVYYRNSNNKADGIILIGAKYAYINGYFHNWDFPLSGLQKLKIMKEPFYGLNLVYYYTDRTLEHSYEIDIPANMDVDLESLIQKMKNLNK